MTNMHGVFQLKMRCQRRKVVGIMIHVMAVARLGGPAVASSVMGDDAIAVFEEEQHLRVPVIGRERPAMTENYGLSLAPILIINLRSVSGGDRAHELFSWLLLLIANESLVAHSTGWLLDIGRIYFHLLRASFLVMSKTLLARAS